MSEANEHNKHGSEHDGRWITFVQSIDPRISPESVRLIGDLRKVGYAMRQIGQASIASSGLSDPQYMALMSLYIGERVEGRENFNPSEISDRLGNSRNTTSSLIRALEKDGLVERHLDSDDRRKFIICLSAQGRSLVSEFADKHIGVVGGCFNRLSAAEQHQLTRLLQKLTDNLEEARHETEPPTGV